MTSWPTKSEPHLVSSLRLPKVAVLGIADQLVSDLFIDTVGGKGTFVAIQNKELLREKKMKSIEDKMADVVTEAQKMGITHPELQEMLSILYDNNEE